MNIYWLGHSCFLIKTNLGKRILMDPFDIDIGYIPYKGDVDLVTISHMHFDHNCTKYINDEAKVLTDLVDYQNTFCKVKSYLSFHDDCFGLKRDKNFIFKILCDDINLCHLGDLGHILSSKVIKQLGHIDILFVPVGEHLTISVENLKKVIIDINPRYVIPMHYKTVKLSFYLNTVDKFLMEMKGFKITHDQVLSVNPESLPENTTIKILELTSEDMI